MDLDQGWGCCSMRKLNSSNCRYQTSVGFRGVGIVGVCDAQRGDGEVLGYGIVLRAMRRKLDLSPPSSLGMSVRIGVQFAGSWIASSISWVSLGSPLNQSGWTGISGWPLGLTVMCI